MPEVDSDRVEVQDVVMAGGLPKTKDPMVTKISTNQADEMETLRAQANAMQESLAMVQKRIEELESDTQK